MLDFINVQETPWGNLGTKLKESSERSEDIVTQLGQTFEVDCEPMKTDILGTVSSYHAIRRCDNNKLLAVINHYPSLVQNVNMFNCVEYLMPNEAHFECGGQLGIGQKVFGVFKLEQTERILDDDVLSYIIVINDHTKSDGKVTIINSPVRLVCMNMLQYAMANSRYCYRVPCTDDTANNMAIGQSVFNNADSGISFARHHADKLIKVKIEQNSHDKIMDTMFPYQVSADGHMLNNKANESIAIKRELFVQCLDADNLRNYEDTAYQYYQAMLDYTQHYFSNVNHAYDLTYRMNNMQGIGATPESAQVKKLLQVVRDVAA